jgi:ABC-type sugar transport system ATPase subunit
LRSDGSSPSEHQHAAETDGNQKEVVLRAVGLSKRFGTIQAVAGVDIEIYAGEITAVVGDNGAGKSTMVKMLCGAVRPDQGSIFLGDERVVLRNPLAARERGIEVVFQDLALAPNRDVIANLFLGREIVRGGIWSPLRILSRRTMRAQARRYLQSLKVDVPRLSGVPVAQLSGGQRQAVAVARAAFWATRVMLMDEPTAALGLREATQVLKLARSIADRGLAVVVVSHILPHVMELADRVVVMRHGKVVADLTEDISSERLVALIVGVDAHDAVSGGAASA